MLPREDAPPLADTVLCARITWTCLVFMCAGFDTIVQLVDWVLGANGTAVKFVSMMHDVFCAFVSSW